MDAAGEGGAREGAAPVSEGAELRAFYLDACDVEPTNAGLLDLRQDRDVEGTTGPAETAPFETNI
jgi:hypothetical protein